MMKRLFLLLIFLCSGLLFAISQNYINPVKKNLADPYIYYENGIYYAYGTDYPWAGFWVYKSTDLVHWDNGHECLNKDKGNFGQDNFWAPEVIKKGDYYYMFYSADYGLCVSRSTSPEGPFVAWGNNKGSLRTNSENQGQWAIDPHYFKDEDGKEYLFYARIGGNGIWVAKLNEDLTNISNDTFCFSEISQREDWVLDDGELTNEGPFVIKKNGTYYLFYSGNGWCNHYSVGYATALNPQGPWTKYQGNPILKEGNGQTNVGGASIIFSPDGSELFLVYHRDAIPNVPCKSRDMCIDRLIFSNGIWSVPSGPSASEEPYPSMSKRSEQTITFDSIPNLNLTDSLGWKLSAKSSSGKSVGFRIDNGAAIIRNDSLLTIGQVGKILITAFQIGDTAIAPCELTRNIFITTNFPTGGIVKYAVNSGNTSNGYNYFSCDLYYIGGDCWTLKRAPDISSVNFPAHVEVYKTFRYGNNFSYLFDKLNPSTNHLVRFHFNNEFYEIERCSDNIIINQEMMLSNYNTLDMVGQDKADIKEFIVKSTLQGEININFEAADRNAIINGIEIIENGHLTASSHLPSQFPFTIYPNPLKNGSLFINVPSLNERTKIYIITQLGKVVYVSELNKNDNIIIPNLPSGIYIIYTIIDDVKYYKKLIIN